MELMVVGLVAEKTSLPNILYCQARPWRIVLRETGETLFRWEHRNMQSSQRVAVFYLVLNGTGAGNSPFTGSIRIHEWARAVQKCDFGAFRNIEI